jgi:uncharacterized protein
MPALVAQHPVMMRFRKALDAAYGERLERVVLFGSRARGEARPDSDWDVAVFIRNPDDIWDETGRLAAIETDLLYDTGEVINTFPFRAGAHADRTGFMAEVRRDGIEL